jgi:hypothetical protein
MKTKNLPLPPFHLPCSKNNRDKANAHIFFKDAIRTQDAAKTLGSRKTMCRKTGLQSSGVKTKGKKQQYIQI